MKEQDFIKIIMNEIGEEFIGDDCAYLKDLGIVVTQDNLTEGIHFKREWYTPFQLGYKSVAVNISDILASGAKPAYISIGLSLPKEMDEDFISGFYKGAKTALHGAKIIGGDITGSDKIFISITAIGVTDGRRISSRKSAKAGYKIVSRGRFGLSSKGLEALISGNNNQEYINAHIAPQLDEEFSVSIAENIKTDYAMMDTSDGLADALFKIAEASNVSIISENIDGMFGAEDYQLIAAVPEDFNFNIEGVYTIAHVYPRQDFILKIDDKKYNNYDELNLYNHFGGNNE